MTDEQRAEALMAKGPVWLVRRVIELEDELDRAYANLGRVFESRPEVMRLLRDLGGRDDE